MDDVSLRREIYRYFAAHGRAPSAGDIDVTGSDLERLAAAHAVVLDDAGEIEFANPFAGASADFVVESGEGRWYGTCVWDGLGILAALHRDGVVRTHCSDCAHPLALEVSDGVLSPSAAVVHFLVPARDWYRDLRFT